MCFIFKGDWWKWECFPFRHFYFCNSSSIDKIALLQFAWISSGPQRHHAIIRCIKCVRVPVKRWQFQFSTHKICSCTLCDFSDRLLCQAWLRFRLSGIYNVRLTWLVVCSTKCVTRAPNKNIVVVVVVVVLFISNATDVILMCLCAV